MTGVPQGKHLVSEGNSPFMYDFNRSYVNLTYDLVSMGKKACSSSYDVVYGQFVLFSGNTCRPTLGCEPVYATL